MARPPKLLSLTGSDPTLLAALLEGLELQKARLEQQIAAVRALTGGKRRGRPPAAAASAPAVAAPAAPRKKRKLSAAARKAIAEAQKKRWAAFRKDKEGTK
ncbi:MAG: hypothetical protein MUC42_08935 [Bryobacter sp.]|jgi:hypothetical protein|nr:hypothetical protein [Bryobacter sp.]